MMIIIENVDHVLLYVVNENDEEKMNDHGELKTSSRTFFLHLVDILSF